MAKIYEIDPMVCPKCGWERQIIAVIRIRMRYATSDAEITSPTI
jgi:hypothetical protein